VASNLDQVLIVIAPQPAPSKDLVERYWLPAHSLGIEPVLVINKAELLAVASDGKQPPFSRLAEYRELGYRVLEVSCKQSPGIDALLPVCAEPPAFWSANQAWGNRLSSIA